MVTAEAERAPTEPQVFTRDCTMSTPWPAAASTRRQVERAVKLSKEKYCSATIMLAKTATITYEMVIVEGDRVPDPV